MVRCLDSVKIAPVVIPRHC